MSYEVGTVISFNWDGKEMYGVVDLVKVEALWVNGIAQNGGYVCKIEDVILNYNMNRRKFIDTYPEKNI